MGREAEIKWSYTPDDFFEVRVEFTHGPARTTIEQGAVRAVLPAERYEQAPEIAGELYETIKGYFVAEQIVKHKSFELSKIEVVAVERDMGEETFCLKQVPSQSRLQLAMRICR